MNYLFQSISYKLLLHRTRFEADMDRDCVSYLFSKGILNRAQDEHANEFLHRLQCIRYVINILRGRNDANDIPILQEALRNYGQVHLADLL